MARWVSGQSSARNAKRQRERSAAPPNGRRAGAGGWCVNDRNAAKTVSRKGRHDRLQPLHTGTSQPSAVGRLRGSRQPNAPRRRTALSLKRTFLVSQTLPPLEPRNGRAKQRCLRVSLRKMFHRPRLPVSHFVGLEQHGRRAAEAGSVSAGSRASSGSLVRCRLARSRPQEERQALQWSVTGGGNDAAGLERLRHCAGCAAALRLAPGFR
jgi:hypothetical protein